MLYCHEYNLPPERYVEQARQRDSQQERLPAPEEVSQKRQHHVAKGIPQTHPQRREQDPYITSQDLIA